MVTLLLTLALAGPKDDPCEAIKPAQQLETSRQQQIDGMVKVGIAGLGRGEGELHTNTDTTWDTALLESDDLARGWFVYQLCAMKRDGVLSASLHEDLMRELFGLAPKDPAASGSVDGAAPTQVSAVDVAEEDGTSLGVVRGKATPEGLELHVATELDALQRRKYPMVTTIVFDVTGKGIGVASTVFGEATVMCGTEPRKVVIPPATSTGTWSYKGKWLAKRILKEARCR